MKLPRKPNVTMKVLRQSFPWYAMFLTKVLEYIRNLDWAVAGCACWVQNPIGFLEQSCKLAALRLCGAFASLDVFERVGRLSQRPVAGSV